MSNERDVTRIVRSWLEEGATALPDRVLDKVLDLLPATHQRRPLWSTWRLAPMNTPFRIAVAAAAVLVVALIGLNVMPKQGVVGGPSPALSPSPTPATPAPTSSPSASPKAIGAQDSVLLPGTYRVADPFSVPFDITLTSTWIIPTPLATSDFSISKVIPSNPNISPAWITVDLVDSVFHDPCHTAAGPTKPPSTVAGIVNAVTHMTGFTPGPVTDVTIGGHTGKHATLTNAIDTDTAGCTGGPMLPMWTVQGGPSSGAQTNGNSVEELWVIDVGGTPVLIDGTAYLPTPDAYRPEIDAIVGSIHFQP